jgi:hypothetical protein
MMLMIVVDDTMMLMILVDNTMMMGGVGFQVILLSIYCQQRVFDAGWYPVIVKATAT